ncbi:hypothetical protein LOK49_LG04G00554 [Camellia lanceoleosa]|uniref:Uncharacterized protein n=1 Tax=Camellia lanceoleosa TaxID=1840588 RepID=A0ACC0I287_9ERIC|nr:hypothetical protein LOK49_LG04G00554 [Camellia lanceoleosa]
MDIFLKLGPHEYGHFEEFIKNETIRVSSMITSPLLVQPIGRVVWIPPPVDWIKINSDASFITIGGTVYASAGVVFRDHLGMIKAMHAIPLRGVRDSYEAELKAARCSLLLAQQYGFTKILIQLDNSFIVKAINGGELPIEYYDLYRTLPLKEFKSYVFDYIPREGNQAANFLATRARIWMVHPSLKTTTAIDRVFQIARDVYGKKDMAMTTYFRLKEQIADFVQDGSDPYVQESSSAISSTSFPGPVSVGIIPLQGGKSYFTFLFLSKHVCLIDVNLSDFENEETSSYVQEYKIDITRIMRGEDNRTTVMIHNIPKRYVKFN